ncbi:peptidoglycan editing factor PgeF [Sedimenticola selenatireducens]|uniref:Purine nucleoside phosphorylase n=1 Tax=Sedimenticola selenatireducens TaxID=191960 RepID=A0A557S053_9GAMM|nr:peptidoglycan editing factor PgeF [Sedimenticola selenatireducens]TVO70769.1 peptidoglycan editing factor PgeF [Sedimenticola selenatireducens]TVT65689.1 MAG: peptidoglycan editing factor PgeF [Sedimenticola selenatireducens]
MAEQQPVLLTPEWPAPRSIKAVMTTRHGGMSKPPYDSLNLGEHVGDDLQSVLENRRLLVSVANLPSMPLWLNQVHGTNVLDCAAAIGSNMADAVTTDRPQQVCVVMTADCLPVLLCNRAGTRVAAVHAGWRGLAEGVIEAALSHFDDSAEQILAWLGPAIGPETFEVGAEVRERFLHDDLRASGAFVAGRPDHWMADIYQLARIRLERAGVGFIGGGDYCTVTDNNRFFSYRRDGVTGRMASLIWIE